MAEANTTPAVIKPIQVRSDMDIHGHIGLCKPGTTEKTFVKYDSDLKAIIFDFDSSSTVEE